MAPLSDRHRKELEVKSAIGRKQVEARGYRTVESDDELSDAGFYKSQMLTPGLLVPILGPDGGVVTYQFKPDDPRDGENGKPLKYENPYGSRSHVDCPPGVDGQLGDSANDLWITEGVKKADAAVSAGLCCLSIQGVWNWRGTRSDGTNGPLEEWDSIALEGRGVYIAYDSDVMRKDGVQSALHDLARFLTLRGAHVWWVMIPEKTGLAGEVQKVGLDDHLADGGTVDDLYRFAVRPDTAIRIDGKDLRDLTRDALSALIQKNEPPTLFQRDSDIVEAQPSGVVQVRKDRMRFLLSEAAGWHTMRTVKGKTIKKPADPPLNVISNVLVANELWSFPILDRIVTTPVFAGDGTLRTEPGYHAASRSLYVPPDGLDVPPVKPHPSTRDVRESKALIDELFQDFVFVDDADRAHAWTMLLQPFAREMIRGATPMFSVEAPKQGTGKTLLVQSSLAPVVGVVDSFAEPHGNEEMEKRLTATFMDAAPVLFFDNVERYISYSSLASALTKESWTGRVLGQSATSTSPITCTFVLTANNPRYHDDLARRIARIRLDANVENPNKRQGFALSLPSWALQNRGRLVWAACTLIAAWVARGRPGVTDSTPRLGSYGPWRRVMGGILELHEIPGFLGNLHTDEASESSPAQETLETVLEAALDHYGVEGWFLASKLGEVLWLGDYELPAVQGTNPEQISQNLGYFLRAHRDQIIGGFRLERAPKSMRRRGGYPWRFVSWEG